VVATEGSASPRKAIDSALAKMEAQAKDFKSKFSKAKA
jgi:ribosome-associated translation inhibitor RaiA